jgi:hypothetical protein
MRVLLLALALLTLSPLPAAAAAPPIPIDLRTVFASLQPNDCTTDPSLCNDNNSCTTDACLQGSCVHQSRPNGSPCSDGNACTLNDACSSGQCIGTPVTCTDGDLCTIDSCNTATGNCVFPFACDDGIVCTEDTCNGSSGACAHAPADGAFDAPTIAIFPAESGIKLSWDASGAVRYEIHRSTNPYFSPTIDTFVTELTTPPFTFTDEGVLKDTKTNYSYGVLAVCLNANKRSKTVGEFGFEATPGSE